MIKVIVDSNGKIWEMHCGCGNSFCENHFFKNYYSYEIKTICAKKELKNKVLLIGDELVSLKHSKLKFWLLGDL